LSPDGRRSPKESTVGSLTEACKSGRCPAAPSGTNVLGFSNIASNVSPRPALCLPERRRRAPIHGCAAPSCQAFMPTAWAARPSRSRSTFTNIRDGRHLLVRDGAGRTHELLKTGEDTRIPFHHVALSGHPVVANIRIPSWVDWNRYRGAIRRLCRDLRRGVPRTPSIGTGMGGACGQLQSSAPQTGRHEGSRCYPSDECSFHVAGPLFSWPPAP
jgi:hypothetical protein